MTNEELKYIQQLFQLHVLIAEGKSNSDEANQVREDMECNLEKDPEFNRQMQNISCYCYALSLTNFVSGAFDDSNIEDMARRYRDVLFADTIDSDELDKIFAKEL